jgi:hypothetical protein
MEKPMWGPKNNGHQSAGQSAVGVAQTLVLHPSLVAHCTDLSVVFAPCGGCLSLYDNLTSCLDGKGA